MSSTHLDSQMIRRCNITDFVQTFQRDTGLNFTSCRNIVQDSGSIFYTFSYLIQHLFSLINSVTPLCQTFIIKGLTVPQRRHFYIELSKIGINFTKTRYFDNNNCTDIQISIDGWSVPDYRITPELAIYQHRINIFNIFYSSIDTSFIRTAPNGNIIVSLENFLKFKRIFTEAVSSYNLYRYSNYNNNIIYTSNQLSNTTTQYPHSQLHISSNNNIKHQLADLIFDVKDNLSDFMYKEILEKIALISP
jgi:hypothetical protein